MAQPKIRSFKALIGEMKTVARGERPAPADAAAVSFNSVDAYTRLLTGDNRKLLRLIRDKRPQSIAELVKLSGRAQPNVTRTLKKLKEAGLVGLVKRGKIRKAPVVTVQTIHVEIDPFSARRDKLRLSQ
jgi:predicted transcriptional regulator